MRHFFTAARMTMVIGAGILLAACEPLSLTVLGIGGTTAVNHKLGGTKDRTFTASLAKVRLASIDALRRMGIKADSVKQIENGELFTARAGKREIEVELESLTPRTTRMKVMAREGGFLYDGATASEIIVQTGKSLGV
jgi:hypothetical protein